MKPFVLACSLLFAASSVAAQDRPPDGYESPGVCPFECCTYREWTAAAAIPVRARRSDASRVLFRLRPNEKLQALTGVVVTDKPIAIRIDRPVRDGYVKGKDEPQLSLKPGDVVYQLVPLGEGAYRFWYRGKTYNGGLDLAAIPAPAGSRLKTTWWKQVRNAAGQTGWTRSDKFKNADACG